MLRRDRNKREQHFTRRMDDDPLNLGVVPPTQGSSPKSTPLNSETASSPNPTAGGGQRARAQSIVSGKLEGKCIQCGREMRNFLGIESPDGPLHNECVAEYRRTHVELCVHCSLQLREARTIVQGKKFHPECVADFKAGKPFVPPYKCGTMQKFSVGRSRFGMKNWQTRFFVLSPKTSILSYFETEAEALAFQSAAPGNKDVKPPKGTVALDANARLITKPTHTMHHLEARETAKDLIIVFKESGRELRLLIRFDSWDQKLQWVKVFESYVPNVDDPKDYDEVANQVSRKQ